MPSQSLAAIKAACDAAVADPSLKPVLDADGNVVTTYCNVAVQRIAQAAGYSGFAGLMANDIVAKLASDPQWASSTASQAAAASAQGSLAIACHSYQPHGHVVVIYPGGGLVYSGAWKADAAVVANVGKDNKICGANFAFPVADTPPSYYVWNPADPPGAD